MEQVTQEALQKAFPHGITVAQDGEGQNFDMVHVAVRTEGPKLAVLGWAYPNKDMLFFPEEVTVRDDGDWIFKSQGRMYRFAALDEKKANDLKSLLAEF